MDGPLLPDWRVVDDEWAETVRHREPFHTAPDVLADEPDSAVAEGHALGAPTGADEGEDSCSAGDQGERFPWVVPGVLQLGELAEALGEVWVMTEVQAPGFHVVERLGPYGFGSAAELPLALPEEAGRAKGTARVAVHYRSGPEQYGRLGLPVLYWSTLTGELLFSDRPPLATTTLDIEGVTYVYVD